MPSVSPRHQHSMNQVWRSTQMTWTGLTMTKMLVTLLSLPVELSLLAVIRAVSR